MLQGYPLKNCVLTSAANGKIIATIDCRPYSAESETGSFQGGGFTSISGLRTVATQAKIKPVPHVHNLKIESVEYKITGISRSGGRTLCRSILRPEYQQKEIIINLEA